MRVFSCRATRGPDGRDARLPRASAVRLGCGVDIEAQVGVLRKLESWRDWQIALAIAVALRVFYSAVAAALSFYLRLDPGLIHSNALTESLATPGSWHYALLGVWERFDTLWYLHIAEHGYNLPMAVIFYPLFPAAIRLASFFFPAIVAALVVSTIAAFFFFWGLLRLTQAAYPPAGKLRMLLLVCAWPTSFVLFAGYADSLTLALVVWAVVFAREGRWWSASICGMLAGAARPSGVLVVIPLFVLALGSRRLRSAAVLLSPLGWLAYWAWLHWLGHHSVIEAYRLYQGMTLVPPWQGLWEILRLIVNQGDVLLTLKLGLVIVFALLSVRRDVRFEDKLFSLAVLLQMLMYSGRPLLGAMRYLLLVYPAFLTLGEWTTRMRETRFAFLSAALFAANLAWMWAFLNWSLAL